MINNYKQIKQLNDLDNIFRTALDKVDPYKLIKENIKLSNFNLTIKYKEKQKSYGLRKFNKVFIIGAGKATFKMAKAMEEILQNIISSGIISVKHGYKETLKSESSNQLKNIRVIESGHPVPDNSSIKAAHVIEKLAEESDENTLFINLISGGGSALLCYPYKYQDISLTLKDIQITNQTLLECGADITEINCIRKHISQIKGGKLLELLYPAKCITLILSDVIGDKLDTIASGLTTYDNSTFKDAKSIIVKYKISNKLPDNVLKIISLGYSGKIKETIKINDRVLKNCDNYIIGTNYTALKTAQKKADELGYNTNILKTDIIGEAKEAAEVFIIAAKNILKSPIKKPECIIAGGETTVTIKGTGKGGRNQELALSFLNELKNLPDNKNIYFLSASTDGNDGPTDASGAFACREVLKSAEAKYLEMGKYLSDNNSYNFFKQAGFLYKTGLTNTNVCDIQILIVE